MSPRKFWTTYPWTPAHRLFDRYFPRQFPGKHVAVQS